MYFSCRMFLTNGDHRVSLTAVLLIILIYIVTYLFPSIGLSFLTVLLLLLPNSYGSSEYYLRGATDEIREIRGSPKGFAVRFIIVLQLVNLLYPTGYLKYWLIYCGVLCSIPFVLILCDIICIAGSWFISWFRVELGCQPGFERTPLKDDGKQNYQPRIDKARPRIRFRFQHWPCWCGFRSAHGPVLNHTTEEVLEGTFSPFYFVWTYTWELIQLMCSAYAAYLRISREYRRVQIFYSRLKRIYRVITAIVYVDDDGVLVFRNIHIQIRISSKYIIMIIVAGLPVIIFIIVHNFNARLLMYSQ